MGLPTVFRCYKDLLGVKNNVVKKMLSDWKAPYIQSLNKLIETQSKATLAIWAVDYSERVILPLWRKYYPDDLRPQNALNAAREWLSGTIKLRKRNR